MLDFMKKRLTKASVSLLLSVVLLLTCCLCVVADSTPVAEGETTTDNLELNCKSAVLMEASTGKILYQKEADVPMPPASVTKIMTLLLVMEAIQAGQLKMTDMVTASAHAASMGGSQIYLKEGESMTAEDMIKSVVISSANDAAVALAEHIAGSEAAFVDRMNKRARELGMNHTNFENTNGLDDTATNHVTSAKDIAIMSRALIAHKEILKYSSIWMDTIRNGAFGLTNTNRLVRFYKGCNGLKTGSTQKAGFCISATAERNGMTLICVIMGAETRDIRNAAATALLDWGFANYGLYQCEGQELGAIRVTCGEREYVKVAHGAFACVLPKASVGAVEKSVELPDTLTAPVRAGEDVGAVVFVCQGKEVGRIAIQATETSERIGFWGLFRRMLGGFLLI